MRTRTPWRPSKIPPLSPHTLSIIIQLLVSSTLLAMSWAVDGVRGQLFNPSHHRLPCASIGYSGLVLRQACEELGLPQRCCVLAALTPSTARDMVIRVELMGSGIVIESVCRERGGNLLGLHGMRVRAEKETILFFFFQMTRRYERASHFVSQRWLRLLNTDNI